MSVLIIRSFYLASLALAAFGLLNGCSLLDAPESSGPQPLLFSHDAKSLEKAFKNGPNVQGLAANSATILPDGTCVIVYGNNSGKGDGTQVIFALHPDFKMMKIGIDLPMGANELFLNLNNSYYARTNSGVPVGFGYLTRSDQLLLQALQAHNTCHSLQAPKNSR